MIRSVTSAPFRPKKLRRALPRSSRRGAGAGSLLRVLCADGGWRLRAVGRRPGEQRIPEVMYTSFTYYYY